MDVEARLLDLQGTGESVPAALARVRFRNGSNGRREVREYAIEWPGGRLVATPRDLRLAPGAEVDRTVRLDSRHGDITALLADHGRVKVQVLKARED